jgi:transcriptional regulator with XRE-family HTH domain
MRAQDGRVRETQEGPVPKPAVPDYRWIVGRNIARLRDRKDMTQQEMGAEVRRYLDGQWTKATVSAIENGKRPLEVSELVMLAVVLEVPVADLLLPSLDGTPLTDTDRVRFRDKKTPVRVDEVGRRVAPTAKEQAQMIAREVGLVLQESTGISVTVTPATVRAKAAVPKPTVRTTKRSRGK